MRADVLSYALIAASRELRQAQDRGNDGQRLWLEVTEIGIIAISTYQSGGHEMRHSCEVRWSELLSNAQLARHSALGVIRAAGLEPAAP